MNMPSSVSLTETADRRSVAEVIARFLRLVDLEHCQVVSRLLPTEGIR